MIPSVLTITFFPNVIVVRNRRMLAKIAIIKSKFTSVLKGNGLIVAVVPRIKKTLKIFEPITFPMIISGFFLRAATIEVANSGKDVPIAIIVSPITR